MPAPIPIEIKKTGANEITVRWDDGHESIYAPAAGAVGRAEPAEKE